MLSASLRMGTRIDTKGFMNVLSLPREAHEVQPTARDAQLRIQGAAFHGETIPNRGIRQGEKTPDHVPAEALRLIRILVATSPLENGKGPLRETRSESVDSEITSG